MAKWLVFALLLLHGLIHLMGVAKAFGLAELPQLTSSISRPWGAAWGASAALLLAAALARAANAPWWWMLGAIAVLLSQVVIVVFWTDARFGTVANVLLLVPLVVGFGGWRFAAQSERDLAALQSRVADAPASVVGAEELTTLPPLVSRWLQRAGVPGRPRARFIYLNQRGTMQKSVDGGWMPFRAEQWFTVDDPGFLWTVDVEAGFGLSLAGRDHYADGRGSMRIELLCTVPVVDASGPTIDQGTLVRFLAEIMWFPSAALQPYVEWESVDERTARATMRYRGVEGAGLFRFDAEGNVVGFEARRYRDDALEDWIIENDPQSFRPLDGIRMPTRSTITWRDDAGERWTWLRLEVTAVERNPVLAGP